ncbi:hypothetical protein EXS65_00365 [Candidatus Peribacteria bacterium]|nr:hypothetical protein [Candidatus Peribacteria bacterium]
MHHSETTLDTEHHVQTILLGVSVLVDNREWNHAIHKFQRLETLVRNAIRACLLKHEAVETVHTAIRRATMNSEHCVQTVGRRLEEFFRHTFEIPSLHSKRTDDDDSLMQSAEPDFNVHDHDEDEHEPPMSTHDEDDEDDEWPEAA